MGVSVAVIDDYQVVWARGYGLDDVEGGKGAIIMTNGDRGSELAREILYAIAAEYGW